jgi:hypothetical protein
MLAKRASKGVFRVDWMPQRYFSRLKPLVLRFCGWDQAAVASRRSTALNRALSPKAARRVLMVIYVHA